MHKGCSNGIPSFPTLGDFFSYYALTLCLYMELNFDINKRNMIIGNIQEHDRVNIVKEKE